MTADQFDYDYSNWTIGGAHLHAVWSDVLKRYLAEKNMVDTRCNDGVEKVRSISQVLRETLSLETTIGDKDEDTLKNVLKDSAAVLLDFVSENSRSLAYITGWQSKLSKCESRVIDQRFGLNDDEPKTLDCIGKDYKIRRERVRQIENVALNKLCAITRYLNIASEGML